MKAADVYGILRTRLDPAAAALGFTRLKRSQLTYTKKVAEADIEVGFQVTRDPWDDVLGSRFTINFSAKAPDIREPAWKWCRIAQASSAEQREMLRRAQNQVRAKIVVPGDHRYRKPEVIDFFGLRFLPLTEPIEHTDDLWLQYLDASDILMWADIIASQLPEWTNRLTAWSFSKWATVEEVAFVAFEPIGGTHTDRESGSE